MKDAMLDLEPIPFAGMVDITMTQLEVAEELGVSRQTVNNIEQSAFKKIRQELFKRGIDREDLL